MGLLALAVVVPQVARVSPAAASPVSGIVNTYQKVSAVSGTTVTVTGATRGAATPFAVGDRVMLIQMTGLSPLQSGSNMGNYDNATITAVSGSSITLSAITRTYSPSTQAVQLVRAVYDPGTTTVVGTVTAAPWNGATGGVVALSGGTLTLSANIDASATGFTTVNGPTATATTSLTSGAGSTTGRGATGGTFTLDPIHPGSGGGGGGGLGGGGVVGLGGQGAGAGRGGGGQAAGTATASAGSNGGQALANSSSYDGTAAAAAGGGGVIGGGGGGGSTGGGGGGGTDGGGGGGSTLQNATFRYSGAGGGGPMGVGNGGGGLIGDVSGTSTSTSENEGSAGGGGGSYGGGGGAASNFSGGDDSAGGGGGGSWTGGGLGGPGGSYSSGLNVVGPYPSGGDGNAAVGTPIPASAHYLNAANPRLMMGGAGGRGSQDSGFSSGGAGGGVVYADFQTITGSGAIRSNGAGGAAPAGGGAHSGSGGGAGGQMRIRAGTIATTGNLVLGVNGGVGGAPTANNYHGGVSGGGGGAGGVWLELAGATASCPASGVPNVTFQLAGGDAGPSITNPKNGVATGRAGNGGAGLGCVSPPVTTSVSLTKAFDGTRANVGDQFTMEIHQGSLNGPIVGTTGSATTTGTGGTVTTGTGTTTIDPATVGTTYYLTEVGAGGANLPDYTKTISCVDTSGGTPGPYPNGGVTGTTSSPGSAVFNPATGYAVTPLANATIACTLTNKSVAAPAISFHKDFVSATPNAAGVYTVVYTVTVTNTGTAPGTYTLVDTLRPGAGAIFQSGTWSGPTNGTFTAANTATTLATNRSLSNAAGSNSETYTVTAVYAIDGTLITGSGSTASNECKTDGTDYTGSFGFHNTATLTSAGTTTSDDACGPFERPLGKINLHKVIVDPSPWDGAGDASSFPVTVSCTGPGGAPAVVRNVTIARDGTVTTVDNLYVGSVCTVTETNTDGGTATISPSQPITVSSGTPVSITVTNTFPDVSARLRWRKVDPSGTLLRGSEWTLTPVDGAGAPTGPALAFGDCTQAPCTGTDTDPTPGEFLVVGLQAGAYRLVETRAPSGFVLDPTPIAAVLTATNEFTLADVVNDQHHVPVLPFAGGIGSDHVWLGGLALLVTAGVLGTWQRRRHAGRQAGTRP